MSANQPQSDGERLDKLEKEVCCLRSDFDRIKWEQAVAEAAIGRAIIRGSASLGASCGMILPPGPNNLQSSKNLMLEDSQRDGLARLAASQMMVSDKKCPAGAPEKLKKNGKEECGYFTFG